MDLLGDVYRAVEVEPCKTLFLCSEEGYCGESWVNVSRRRVLPIPRKTSSNRLSGESI